MVGKPDWKRHEYVNNTDVKTDFREIAFEYFDWNHLAQGKVQWLFFFKYCGIFGDDRRVRRI
jgi:hypothetical protein